MVLTMAPCLCTTHLTTGSLSSVDDRFQDDWDDTDGEEPVRLHSSFSDNSSKMKNPPGGGGKAQKKWTASRGRPGRQQQQQQQRVRLAIPTGAAADMAGVVSHEYVDHLDDPLVGPSSPRVGVKEAFPFKLHKMLQEATIEQFDSVVSWLPHGRAFRVHDRETFIRDIMPRFFQQTKITSFNRQLCLYGFVRLTAAGDDRGAYYHELCIRSRPDLLRQLQRTRIKGTGKKAASSPQTEPDFYRMKYCPEDDLILRVRQQGPPSAPPSSTSPKTTTVSTNDHRANNKTIKLVTVTPNPSPRRTRNLSAEHMSAPLFPKSVSHHQPMMPPPPSYQPLPMGPRPSPQLHFLAVPPEEDYAASSEAYLDSNQFSFAWDDVDI